MTTENASSVQMLHAKYNAEIDTSRREIAEIEMLIRQNTSEVEKLQQREMTITSRLRDLEVNAEKYSKTDIKNIFQSAQEAQIRLLSTRAQLEQQQMRFKAIKQRQSELFELVNAIEPLIVLAPAAGRGRAADSGDDQIARVIEAQERERQRISLQMHDGPAQSMSNLMLRAEICQKLIDRDIDMARTELGELKSAINITLQDTRRFIFDLRPMTLDDLGLVPTLRRFTQQFTEKTKVDVQLSCQNADSRLPQHYEVAIFRFIQEALNNVAKHASSPTARVRLDVGSDGIHISIDDDGIGFSVHEVLADTGSRHTMGLAMLRQHAESLLRGEFGIESTMGRGTRVAAVIPLP